MLHVDWLSFGMGLCLGLQIGMICILLTLRKAGERGTPEGEKAVMKQYVVTDEEFEELLRTLELHKFNGAASLQTSVAIEIKRAVEEMEKSGLPGTLTKQTTDFVMADAYRTFLYHVHTWIQKEKR